MNESPSPLAEIEDAFDAFVTRVIDGHTVPGLDDDALLELVTTAGAIARRAEALLVETASEVERRSSTVVTADRLTTRRGCASPVELIERCARVARPTAAGYLRAGAALRPTQSVTSGEWLPPALPGLRDALAEGTIGADALHAMLRPIRPAAARIPDGQLADASDLLAAAARGDGPAGPLGAHPAELGAYASLIVEHLDPDGAEPREQLRARKRALHLGRPDRHGMTPIRGHLQPEAAAQLQRIIDALTNPRVGFHPVVAPAGAAVDTSDASAGQSSDPSATEGRECGNPVPDGETGLASMDPADLLGDEAAVLARADDRTAAQRRHDALMTALTVAARSQDLPTIGGAAPTLVIDVTAETLISGRGHAHAEGGSEPLSPAAARHAACAGTVYRVTRNATGRILQLGISDRTYNHHQRRAIALRDGGCIIPGCRTPVAWCEIHHVTEHADGGPTHTDNGVLLCWHHHRTLETSGWRIRMVAGYPQVQAPSWLDPTGAWRATSPRGRPQKPPAPEHTVPERAVPEHTVRERAVPERAVRERPSPASTPSTVGRHGSINRAPPWRRPSTTTTSR